MLPRFSIAPASHLPKARHRDGFLEVEPKGRFVGFLRQYVILDFKGPGTTAAAVTVHSGLLWIDGGVRAKAEILNPFQRRVGFIPRKERDHECDDGDDQGQMFHQRQPKHLGTQFGQSSAVSVICPNACPESRVWTPE